jgi:hypothetical protein
LEVVLELRTIGDVLRDGPFASSISFFARRNNRRPEGYDGQVSGSSYCEHESSVLAEAESPFLDNSRGALVEKELDDALRWCSPLLDHHHATRGDLEDGEHLEGPRGTEDATEDRRQAEQREIVRQGFDRFR